MSFITTTCPHCHTANTSFFSIAEKVHTANQRKFTVFFCCAHCDGGIAALIQTPVGQSVDTYPGDLKNSKIFEILDIQPKAPSIDIPEFLPANIASYYRQAADNDKHRNWDACGAMCRKALDVATKNFSKEHKLYERIDELATKNIITPQLKDWAHAIRLDGNDALHNPDPFDEAQSSEILNFTYVYLQHTYTMPGMLNDRRNMVASAKKT